MRLMSTAAALFAHGLDGLLLAAGSATAAVLVPSSPVFLPSTSCRAARGAIDALVMGMTYAEAVRALGCEGVLAGEEQFGTDLTVIEYVWRTDVRPFGVLRAKFYNGSLQSMAALGYEITWTVPEHPPAHGDGR